MALPVWAIMAIAGAAKGEMDRRKEEKERQARAQQMVWAPFTGMEPDPISTKGDVVGSAFQGGLAGYAMDQNMAQNDMFGAGQNMSAAAPGTNSVQPVGSGGGPSSTWSMMGGQMDYMNPYGSPQMPMQQPYQGPWRPGMKTSYALASRY